MIYYSKAIEMGRITVNDQRVTQTYLVKDSDLIQHKLHQHEPKVSGQNIDIIYQDSETLVVNKPASIPVHPTGKYHYNSLCLILQKEYGFPQLHRTLS